MLAIFTSVGCGCWPRGLDRADIEAIWRYAAYGHD